MLRSLFLLFNFPLPFTILLKKCINAVRGDSCCVTRAVGRVNANALSVGSNTP